MSTAPAWLSYASPAIAIVALLVAAATYRRAGPRIRVKANTVKPWGKPADELDIEIRIINCGLAQVQVVEVSAAYVWVNDFVAASVRLTKDDMYEGPDLPAKLEGGHSMLMTYDVKSAISREYGPRSEARAKFKKQMQGLAGVKTFWRIGWETVLRSPNYLLLPGLPRAVVLVSLGNGTAVSVTLWRLTWAVWGNHKAILAADPTV